MADLVHRLAVVLGTQGASVRGPALMQRWVQETVVHRPAFPESWVQCANCAFCAWTSMNVGCSRPRCLMLKVVISCMQQSDRCVVEHCI